MAASINVDSRSPVHKQMDGCCLSMGAAMGPPPELYNVASPTAASQPEDCACALLRLVSQPLVW